MFARRIHYFVAVHRHTDVGKERHLGTEMSKIRVNMIHAAQQHPIPVFCSDALIMVVRLE